MAQGWVNSGRQARRWLSGVLGVLACALPAGAEERLWVTAPPADARQQALATFLSLHQALDGPRGLWTLALTSEDEWIVALGHRTCSGDKHCHEVLARRWLQKAPGNFSAWWAALPHLTAEEAFKGLEQVRYANDHQAAHCAAFQALPATRERPSPGAWPARWPSGFLQTFELPRELPGCSPSPQNDPVQRQRCEAAAEIMWRWGSSASQKNAALSAVRLGRGLSTVWRSRYQAFHQQPVRARWEDANATTCPHPVLGVTAR